MKKWIRPELTIIKRESQEAVLRCCKTEGTSGPGVGTCAQHDLYCCYDVGSS